MVTSEAIKARNTAWWATNKSVMRNKRRAYYKAYYDANKAKIHLKVRKRKQHLAVIDELCGFEWAAMVRACENRCLKCGESPVTKDHVKPLHLGGRHHISNIQPLCQSCNSSKGATEADYRGVRKPKA